MMQRRFSRRSLRARLARATKRLRAARGWTQEEAAEAANLNLRHYQKVERGSVNATLDTIERLCQAFAVDVVALFEP